MESTQKSQRKIGVQIIKSTDFDEYKDPIYSKTVEKSDKSEQLDRAYEYGNDWIPHPVDMRGLEILVQHSTILPQCIKAYKNNIAGFGLSIKYSNDEEETDEMKAEWDTMQRLLDLLNMDTDTKEVFENIIASREKYGIAYIECIRNSLGEVVEIDNIKDTPSIEMTYPLSPYVDIEYNYKGEVESRKKKFRKFRQNIGGKIVYFKEFGDPRVMDKTTGAYGGDIPLEDQANEIMDFKIGSDYYGEVRWIGQMLNVDGNFRAEKLNNNYFRNGRHTPLMIIVKGGTLSEESVGKLEQYMNEIKGENGQHSFILLETEKNETTISFDDKDNGPDVEVKDLANILQHDELFQEYQDNGRKKVQSSFLLPDLYVGYTTDFNRATAQTAMEVTEKQVFQPERKSLAWQVNNKLFNGYAFKHVEVYFEEPDITNPDDIMKILNITERAGGLTLNDARDLTKKTLGEKSENYPDTFDLNDIGNIPLAVLGKLQSISPAETLKPLDKQIEKAMRNHDDDVVAVMKEVKRLLIEMDGDAA